MDKIADSIGAVAAVDFPLSPLTPLSAVRQQQKKLSSFLPINMHTAAYLSFDKGKKNNNNKIKNYTLSICGAHNKI